MKTILLLSVLCLQGCCSSHEGIYQEDKRYKQLEDCVDELMKSNKEQIRALMFLLKKKEQMPLEFKKSFDS